MGAYETNANNQVPPSPPLPAREPYRNRTATGPVHAGTQRTNCIAKRAQNRLNKPIYRTH